MLIMIQVGDFGLSRLKANTFLSSKTAAGTVSFHFDFHRLFCHVIKMLLILNLPILIFF